MHEQCNKYIQSTIHIFKGLEVLTDEVLSEVYPDSDLNMRDF